MGKRFIIETDDQQLPLGVRIKDGILNSWLFNVITLRAYYFKQFSDRYNGKVKKMVAELEKAGEYTHVFTSDHPLQDISITGRILVLGDRVNITGCFINSGIESGITVSPLEEPESK